MTDEHVSSSSDGAGEASSEVSVVEVEQETSTASEASDVSETTTFSAEDTDELRAQYVRTLRQITSLPEIPMRRAAMARTLEDLDVEVAVWWIDQLLRGALWGKSPETDAMTACADYLVRLRLDDDYDRLQAMYQAAAAADRESVLFLLRDPPAHRTLGDGADLPEVRLPKGEEVTLGERRSMARAQNRRMLERLLMDPSPLVLQKLLDNPQIRVQEVLSVAARRPTTPELVMKVVLHPKWFKEIQIREAIVFNPFTPTGVSLKLLPTLNLQLLRRVRNATDLHPLLREAAELYVELREQRTAPWKV